jgi:hypothetical protein
MATRHIEGTCRLCGERKPLSFEHVPPCAAYNSYPRFHLHTTELINHRVAGGPSPTVVPDPRGAGGYTLCSDCNNRCSRYATHFVDWAVGWQNALESEPTAPSIRLSQMCRRNRIMKQIAAMFLSANPPTLGEAHVDLRRFVWNAQFDGLPKDMRVLAALTRDRDARQAGIGGKLSTVGSGATSIYSEIAFAPLILVMTFDNEKPPDSRLLDITFFVSAGYGEKLTTEIDLKVLRLRDFYPGAYY